MLDIESWCEISYKSQKERVRLKAKTYRLHRKDLHRPFLFVSFSIRIVPVYSSSSAFEFLMRFREIFPAIIYIQHHPGSPKIFFFGTEAMTIITVVIQGDLTGKVFSSHISFLALHIVLFVLVQ